MPSSDKAGQACVAFALFGFLLITVVFTQGFAVASGARVDTPPPSPLASTVSLRRALRQVPLERDLVPGGFTELVPGTSGAGPNYWLPNAFVNEVPGTLATQSTLYLSNAVDKAKREFNAAPNAFYEAWGALMRYSVVGGVDSGSSGWLVPPTFWPSGK